MPNSAVNTVIEGIRGKIERGHLKNGERFPAERALADEFGVSRSSVREAIRYYENIGLAETRPGSGTYLIDNPNTMSNIVDARQVLATYNFNEMNNARRVIEVGLAKFAAENATRNDKIVLRSILDRIESFANAGLDSAEAVRTIMEEDYRLHSEIARIANNSFLAEMHKTLRGAILASSAIWEKGGDISVVVNPYHEEIVDGICNNNPKAAEIAMTKHLDYIENWFNKET